jgi:hypothetical protein
MHFATFCTDEQNSSHQINEKGTLKATEQDKFLIEPVQIIAHSA